MMKQKLQMEVARVYDAPAPDGRVRVLVDRLWPRGVKKEDLKLNAWMKELAPSAELRRWFNHDRRTGTNSANGFLRSWRQSRTKLQSCAKSPNNILSCCFMAHVTRNATTQSR